GRGDVRVARAAAGLALAPRALPAEGASAPPRRLRRGLPPRDHRGAHGEPRRLPPRAGSAPLLLGPHASSALPRKCSSASGFASASTFFTAWPCTTARTASSTILLLL